MVYHYGTFVSKKGVTQSQIDRCFAEMRGTVGKIPGPLLMQHGVYQSDEGLNDGFTHGFVMTFDSPGSRDRYLPHPRAQTRQGDRRPEPRTFAGVRLHRLREGRTGPLPYASPFVFSISSAHENAT